MFYRTLLLAACWLASGTALAAETILERAERDEITRMSNEAPAMRRAFEQAKASLDDFLRRAAAPAKNTTGYALKVAVSDGKNTEYFWVNRFSADGDTFSGNLGNEPRLVKKYKLDERFSFQRRQIVDWTYFDTSTKRMHGNFTACALLTQEPPAQAEAFRQRYGLVCD